MLLHAVVDDAALRVSRVSRVSRVLPVHERLSASVTNRVLRPVLSAVSTLG